jgi:hypothetical protein
VTYELRLDRPLGARPDVVFDLWTDIDADKILFAGNRESTSDAENEEAKAVSNGSWGASGSSSGTDISGGDRDAGR